MAATILLVDDHPMLRRSVAWACSSAPEDIRVVGEASDGEEAVALAMALGPDVVVLDLSLPRLHGLEVLRLIKQRAPETKVLVLTADDDHGTMFEAVKDGADGYIDKSVGPDEICRAIADVAAGRRVLSPERESVLMERLGDFVLRSRRASGSRSSPSSTDLMILKRMSQGATTQQIARTLDVSTRTVETRITCLYRSYDVSSRVALLNKARSLGLIGDHRRETGIRS